MDKIISRIIIIVEAIYPLNSEKKRLKGLLRFRFDGIHSLELVKTTDFDVDLSIAFNESGNDNKANEIYSVAVIQENEDSKTIRIESDMLKLSLTCKTFQIAEL